VAGVTGGMRRGQPAGCLAGRSYGVVDAFMSFRVHGWDVHAVSRGAARPGPGGGEAGGAAGGAGARPRARAADGPPRRA